VAEVEDPGAGPEDIERLAHGDVESVAAPGYADEEGIDDPRQLMANGFVPIARERPVQDGGSLRERIEVPVGGVVKMKSSFGHRKES